MTPIENITTVNKSPAEPWQKAVLLALRHGYSPALEKTKIVIHEDTIIITKAVPVGTA